MQAASFSSYNCCRDKAGMLPDGTRIKTKNGEIGTTIAAGGEWNDIYTVEFDTGRVEDVYASHLSPLPLSEQPPQIQAAYPAPNDLLPNGTRIETNYKYGRQNHAGTIIGYYFKSFNLYEVKLDSGERDYVSRDFFHVIAPAPTETAAAQQKSELESAKPEKVEDDGVKDIYDLTPEELAYLKAYINEKEAIRQQSLSQEQNQNERQQSASQPDSSQPGTDSRASDRGGGAESPSEGARASRNPSRPDGDRDRQNQRHDGTDRGIEGAIASDARADQSAAETVSRNLGSFQSTNRKQQQLSGQHQRSSDQHKRVNQQQRREYDQAAERARSTHRSIASIADSVRNFSVEDLAVQFGYQKDKSDKHKWRKDGSIVTIDGQKFYDWLNTKGGTGAIDFVMHVRECNFKEAVSWLSNEPLDIPIRPAAAPPQPEPPRSPFVQPPASEEHWQQVRDYLIQKRHLPERYVDELHKAGIIYADAKRNVVFLRQSINNDFSRGEAKGASLRSSYSDFKGLATGSRRSEGCFHFSLGQSQNINRVVVVEAPIDALSFAAMDKRSADNRTLYIATDGAGTFPEAPIRKVLSQGGQAIVATDGDAAGKKMAEAIIAKFPQAAYMPPSAPYKDWNEQLQKAGQMQQPLVSLDNLRWWYCAARAIGGDGSEAIQAATGYKQGQLPEPQAIAAMQSDISEALSQWQEAAAVLKRPPEYIERIGKLQGELDQGRSLPLPAIQPINALHADIQQYQDLLEREVQKQEQAKSHQTNLPPPPPAASPETQPHRGRQR